MDCTIQRLHSRYQPLARREAVPGMTERLDRVSRHQLTAMLGASLDRALQDDPTVYVLRHLDVRLALHVSSVIADTDLAERWAGKLTGAILRQLANETGQDDGVMRFADPVDFRASFILDVLQGRAWDLWFYASFEKYRERGVARAIQAVLLEDKEELPAILAELMRRGAFERVLDCLGAELVVELWRQGLVGLWVDDPNATRPLFAAAIDLVDRLELWARSEQGAPSGKRAPSGETAPAGETAPVGPAPSVVTAPSRPNTHSLFDDYVASRPTTVDWRDQQSLARGVFEAWQFLADRGHLKSSIASGVLSESVVTGALADLDWLDKSWLVRELRRWAGALVEAVEYEPDPAHGPPGPASDELTQRIEDSSTPEADSTSASAADQRGRRGARASELKTGSTSARKPVSGGSQPQEDGSASTAESMLPEPQLASDEPAALAEEAPKDEVLTAAEPAATTSTPDVQASTLPRLESPSETDPQEPSTELERGELSGGASVKTDAQASLDSASESESSLDRSPKLEGSTSPLTAADLSDVRAKEFESAAESTPSSDSEGSLESPDRRSERSERTGEPVASERTSETHSKELPETERVAEPGEPPGRVSSVSGDESLEQGGRGRSRRQPRESAEIKAPSIPQPDVLPSRPVASGPTPRQRQLLSDLKSSLVQSLGSLERSHPKAAANALRLYGALIADSPRWSGDSLVKPMIEGLLAAWAHLLSTSSTSTALLRLCEGRVEDALRLLPEAEREDAAENLRFLAGLGGPGRDIVAQLLDPSAPPAPADGVVRSRQATDSASTAGQLANGKWIESPCAGLFLLARAVEEVRLASLVAESNLPVGDLDSRLETLLLTLGLRWAGEAGSDGESIDAGLGLLAGFVDPPSILELRSAWGEVETEDCDRFQSALLRLMAGQRVVRGESLELFHLQSPGTVPRVVAGMDGAGIWPLGTVLQSESDLDELLAAWIKSCEAATGRLPTELTCDASLQGRFVDRAGRPAIVSIEGEATTSGDTTLNRAAAAHHNSRELLLNSLDGLQDGILGPQLDLTTGLTALAVLRVWARWLKQFSGSSAAYLLHNSLQRPGVLLVSEEELRVELEPGPMDFVLEMAGYMAPLERVSWLENRTVRFSVRASS